MLDRACRGFLRRRRFCFGPLAGLGGLLRQCGHCLGFLVPCASHLLPGAQEIPPVLG